ncbi:MAG TPA: HEAT repeat domain-containing protein [Polyangiaceae bacterium]|nr:HEAT repeat domain-containing protein [Polyangiaceae bacterium]
MPRSPLRPNAAAALALAALAALAPPAAAEPPPDLRAIEARLRGRDPEALAAALAEAARAGAAASPLRPPIEALAARGLPPPLALAALDALGAIGARESVPLLRRYLRHRRADLRLGALRALRRAGGPAAVAALRPALDDPDARVRGEAASALADLGATDATDDLYRALDRGVPEAAPALGRLCHASACDGLGGRLFAQPFSLLAPGCEALLFRPAAEVPDAQKVALLRRLHDLPPADVHRFVAGWRARWTGSPAVAEALARAAEVTAPARRD